MALRSARADSVHRMIILREFFEDLFVRNRAARVGILEAGVDFLPDEGLVHDFVPGAFLGKLLGQLQHGLFHVVHRSRSLLAGLETIDHPSRRIVPSPLQSDNRSSWLSSGALRKCRAWQGAFDLVEAIAE